MLQVITIKTYLPILNLGEYFLGIVKKVLKTIVLMTIVLKTIA